MARSDTFIDILHSSLLTDFEQQKSIFYVAFVALVIVALGMKLQRIVPAIGLGMQVTKISIAGQFVPSYRFPPKFYGLQPQADSDVTGTLRH